MTTGEPRDGAARRALAPSPGAASLLLAALDRWGWTLGTAESLTAGLVSARVADVPGASRVLRGGVVAYAVDLKEELLGVGADLVADRGVVSEEVALAMATGARELLRVDVALATTGVAGPGSADGADAGTVCLAAVSPAGAATRTWRLAGGRRSVREASAGLAIALGLAVTPSGEHAGASARCTQ
ncbi:nicotinamide-nucleotide amidase [Salana multivorans]|uniref:Nicotinamide-nucleotide amidase n=1 Tax=Salana multivorans TaxID=120377 RepID=A0A3N2D284_9MICO|nr:nicotinamide-nucleotide amidohydrolase family protein [Salana multivorans]ROR93886.1 nicotinamide-nucleotide amidase [Salana multivorans]